MLGEVAGFDESSIAVRTGEGFDSVVGSLRSSKKEKSVSQRGKREEREERRVRRTL